MQASTVSGGVSGAITAVGIWIFSQFYPQTHIPPEIAASIATIVSSFGAQIGEWIGSKSKKSS
jgi:hypothetical protein